MAGILLKLMPAIVLLVVGGEAAYEYYPTYDLNSYCDKLISLPVGRSTYASGFYRGGTLKFSTYPKKDCLIRINVDGYLSDETSIYFNVKTLDLLWNDTVTISEQHYPDSYGSAVWYTTVIKKFTGSDSGYLSPTSVAQVRSSFSWKPTLLIHFAQGSSQNGTSLKALTLDYNVVHEDYSYNTDTYCSSLMGYIHKDYYCESGDRVNCPDAYGSSLTTTLNAAFNKDQGVSGLSGSGCPGYTSSSYSYSGSGYPSYDYYYGPSAGAIAGAVIGSIGGIIFFGAMINIICRRQRAQVVHRHVVPGMRAPQIHPTYTTPIVVQNHTPYHGQPSYPVQQQQPYPQQQQFMGPPPAYHDVQQPQPQQMPSPPTQP